MVLIYDKNCNITVLTSKKWIEKFHTWLREQNKFEEGQVLVESTDISQIMKRVVLLLCGALGLQLPPAFGRLMLESVWFWGPHLLNIRFDLVCFISKGDNLLTRNFLVFQPPLRFAWVMVLWGGLPWEILTVKPLSDLSGPSTVSGASLHWFLTKAEKTALSFWTFTSVSQYVTPDSFHFVFCIYCRLFFCFFPGLFVKIPEVQFLKACVICCRIRFLLNNLWNSNSLQTVRDYWNNPLWLFNSAEQGFSPNTSVFLQFLLDT